MEKDACSFPGCEKPRRYAKPPVCEGHWTQYKRGRKLEPLKHRDRTPAARFEAQIEKRSSCWIWTGTTNRYGYGIFSIAKRKVYAHRHAWEQVNGPIPEGLVIDHICHNTGCVNPSHLRPATREQNCAYRSGPARSNTTGYRGVSYVKAAGKWSAVVIANRQRYYLGLFESPESAANAAAEKRREVHDFPEPSMSKG